MVVERVLVHLRLGQPLGLGPPVLEPDLDLGLAQLQLVGKLRSLGNRQVLFLLELILERHQLLGGEGSPRLPVGLVLSQMAPQGKAGHLTKALKPMRNGGGCLVNGGWEGWSWGRSSGRLSQQSRCRG